MFLTLVFLISSLVTTVLFVLYIMLELLTIFLCIAGKGQDYWDEENISEEMPACCQMFNIFHPFDPVAYRLVLTCNELFYSSLVQRISDLK